MQSAQALFLVVTASKRLAIHSQDRLRDLRFRGGLFPQLSWFSVNRNFGFDELVIKKGLGYSGSGIIYESHEGATGSSSLFRLSTRIGGGMLSRRHRSMAAS